MKHQDMFAHSPLLILGIGILLVWLMTDDVIPPLA